MSDNSDPKESSFAQAGKQEQDVSVLTEFIRFLKHNKRWWMLPILLILLALGLLSILVNPATAPFIYSLF
jgi:hypothetical protein